MSKGVQERSIDRWSLQEGVVSKIISSKKHKVLLLTLPPERLVLWQLELTAWKQRRDFREHGRQARLRQ